MADEVKSTPPPKREMTFGACMDKLLLGERCRRLAWEDTKVYIALKDEKLTIYDVKDGLMHPLWVSAGDISGKDWVIVPRQEEVS